MPDAVDPDSEPDPPDGIQASDETVVSIEAGASGPRMPGEDVPDVRQELESMVRLAEDIQRRCDEEDGRRQLYTVFTTSLFFGGISASAYFIVNSRWPVVPYIVVPLVLTTLLLQARIQLGPRRRLERDRRALREIVSLLRETEQALGHQGAFLPFEQAQLRIRLSRFDL